MELPQVTAHSCSTLPLCTDRCVARPVTGPCRAAFPRYFYNTTSGKCELFTYGGCQGNRNNFETVTECTKECGRQFCVAFAHVM